MAFPCKLGVGGGQLRLIQVNADRARMALARWRQAFSIPLGNGWSGQAEGAVKLWIFKRHVPVLIAATSIGNPTAEAERGADAFISARQAVL